MLFFKSRFSFAPSQSGFFRFWALWCALFCCFGAILSGCGGGGHSDGAPTSVRRVACVGDSITAGVGSSQPYPLILGGFLGRSYSVKNFGSSGTTLLGGGAGAYTSQAVFAQAVNFQPDIVVIELGTNDSYANLDAPTQAVFLRNYKNLLAAFSHSATKPKIFACTPPASYPVDGPRNRINREIITPLIEQAARESGATLIDLDKPLSGQPQLFPDGLHPNYQGAKTLAIEVLRSIQGK